MQLEKVSEKCSHLRKRIMNCIGDKQTFLTQKITFFIKTFFTALITVRLSAHSSFSAELQEAICSWHGLPISFAIETRVTNQFLLKMSRNRTSFSPIHLLLFCSLELQRFQFDFTSPSENNCNSFQIKCTLGKK